VAHPRRPLSLITVLFLTTVAPFSAGAATAQEPVSEETVSFFRQNCASCHTIGGGRLTGPDLKEVSQRQERSWLIGFLMDPKGVLDNGGEYEQGLLAEARGVYMPAVPGMNRALAGKLLDLIDAESLLEESRFAGVQLSTRPLTAADVARGQDLFLGRERFESGSPACVSCHTLAGLGGLGGGRLGPDLTGVYGRLEGRKGLGAWLAAPPSAVMQPLFADDPLDSEEILALVAFLQERAESGAVEGGPNTLNFVMAGIAVAAALMVLFDLLWRRRFRAVRRPLVARS